jgi:GDP-L-fucose synthase
MNLREEVVLITGAYGFLGSHVFTHLISRGARQAIPVGRHGFDLTKADQVEKMYQKHKPTVVIHLAACVGGIGYNASHPVEMFRDNMLMGVYMIDVAARHGVRKFVQIGTSCSYPSSTQEPTKEECLWQGLPVPITAPYGVAKLAMQYMLRVYHESLGMEVAYVIPSNLYGPGDNYDDSKSHVVPALIKRIAKVKMMGDKEVVVWGTGRASRDFLYVGDCARAIIDITEKCNSPEPINLGSGRATPIHVLASKIKDIIGFHGEVVWDASHPDGYPHRCLDISRARSLIGFEPGVALDEGLAITVKDYLNESSC